MSNGIEGQRITIQRPGLLQEERGHLNSTDSDVLFYIWAVADRLGVHAVAAECEWAITQLWTVESVCMRAALELSSGALQRVARNLCVSRDAALQQVQIIRGNLTWLENAIQRSKAREYDDTHPTRCVQKECERELPQCLPSQ